MKLYNIGSKRSFVNLLADFIVKELDPYNQLSLIQVTHCVNFIVVGGKTESKDILDLTNIKNKFNEKYKKIFVDIDISKINIIDLIVYNNKPELSVNKTFGSFFKSDRPMYHPSQIDQNFSGSTYNSYTNRLELFSDAENTKSFTENIFQESYHVSSEFPHGFSINNMRNKLYYSEYVSHNLFSIIGITEIKLNWVGNSFNLDADSFIDVNYIDSMMKDVFEFDAKIFNKKIKEYDLLDDILLPFGKKPWLVSDKVGELFIT